MRRPEEWRSLCATKITSDLEGDPGKILAQAAKAAGLAFEVEPGLDLLEWTGEVIRPWVLGDGRFTAMDAVSWLLGEAYDWDMILEPGTMRIVSRERSIRFWREWVEKK